MNGCDKGVERAAVEGNRLGYWLAERSLPVELVFAYAGDRPMTDVESQRIAELKACRGDELYTDLLFALTHEYFPGDVGKALWNEILIHKFELSTAMKRNVRMTVATLDYLSNLKGQIHAPILMDEWQADLMVGLAIRDGLTHLYNHTACLRMIETEINMFLRYGRIVSFMMIDLDDFKAVNDRYGHQEGDRLLAALAGLIQSATRSTDLCCRYGGEEFAVILPATPLSEAAVLAERIRLLLERDRTVAGEATISIGVASCGDAVRTVQALVDKADSALYEAKRAGKNRIVTAA
jgi:diguanylate cyclase (GGDEF)-like protein